ncbi:MAG: hypothetical protein UT17_C0015G0007 [Candidatus Woesebacteria bacterium GW2011_GWB1_39_10]|uniref:dTDP-4-dehydrorhamnose 3,5-epimerase n=1 Tax=Candidatus Woesebacteria bacterium GW2011_GWB1_39_10 TaxID=1618572 RepID=A0A0G0LH75_9BACT|nr:MAG: hypothetical protein UT17_C0015G0007 [Candidatus Woesebacteria bacterium GW2011_GWB1_39_10]
MKLDPLKLTSTKLTIHSNWEGATIQGVYCKNLKTNVDGRGDLTEIWSEGWSDPNILPPKHVYYNVTDLGVSKGWHWHEETYSQFVCPAGKMQIVLLDLNEKSPTFGHVNQFISSYKNPLFIKIPPFVIKGWKALEENALIINFLTSAGNKDNGKIPFNTFLSDIWQPILVLQG